MGLLTVISDPGVFSSIGCNVGCFACSLVCVLVAGVGIVGFSTALGCCLKKATLTGS